MINHVIIAAFDKRKFLWKQLERDCLARGWFTRLFISGDGSDSSLIYDNIDPDPCNIPDSWKWGRNDENLNLSMKHHYLAYLTHKKIIKYAADNNFPNILLVEDDAYLINSNNRFDKVWYKLLPEIKSLKWDLIYLGCHYGDYNWNEYGESNLQIEKEYKEQGIYRLTWIAQTGGLFGVLINNSIYDLILNLPAENPIDGQLSIFNLKREIKAYVIVPNIIYTYGGFSFCEQYTMKRSILT